MAYEFQVTVDCADPHKLADWWAETLGWHVEPQDEAAIRRVISAGYAAESDTALHNGALVWKEGAAIRHPEGTQRAESAVPATLCRCSMRRRRWCGGVITRSVAVMDSIEAAEFALSLPEVDPDVPSVARIYDFWLGGSQNFACDREAGRRAAQAMPTLQAAIRANRMLLGHMVRRLVSELGVTQLLDLGSGVPTVGNVHEIAQRANPEASVVYVDIDPVAVAHARALLADNPRAHAVLADLRKPESVLGHPTVREHLDPERPLAVLMFAVLHFIPDTEQVGQLIRAFIKPWAPGSYLALSHGAPDEAAPEAQATAARDYSRRTGVPLVPRTREQIEPWLAGLEIQPPGLVDVRVWLPELEDSPVPISPVHGVLARVPEH